MFGSHPVTDALHPVEHTVEALAIRRGDAGVAQPGPVQLGVTLGGLTECKAFPRAEVRLDQVVVNGDVEPKRLGAFAAVS